MRACATRRILALLLVFSGGGLALVQPAGATIHYRIGLNNPEQHLFQVVMTIPDVEPGQEIVVQMPAWNTLYQIRDFAYRVRNVREVVPDVWQSDIKIDKQTWRFRTSAFGAPPPDKSVAIAYSVFWDDPGPFNSQLDPHHAFMNLAQILMYVPARRAEATEIEFDGMPNGWNFAAQLSGGPLQGTFVAPSYDALVDAPVEAGKFDEFEFDSDGAHFRVVVDSQGWNRGRLEDALRRITASELQMMGGPPFRQFTFFFHIGPDDGIGGGGMEHMNSTAIAGISVESVLSVAAHEFFHVWNVKRIRPQAFEPVDYTKEQYTRSLWFAEGFTDAYASFTMERTGLWSKAQFYNNLSAQIDAVQFRSAHKWQSAEESSLDAWLEKYDVYNGADRSISYYDKGEVLGMMLDLAIRDATDNHKSLDDVFRYMNDRFAKQGKFYDENVDIRASVEHVAGKSFEDFFRRYVSGVDEIPYQQFLSAAGLAIRPESNYSISEGARPTDRQRRIREGFLHGTTD